MLSKNLSTTTLKLLTCALLTACGGEYNTTTTPDIKVSPNTKLENIVAEITITNPSSFNRIQEAVYVSYYDLGLSNTDSELAQLQVTQQQQGINSQAIDKDHDGNNDGLFFLTDLAVGQSNTYSIIKSKIKGKKLN